MDNRGLIATIVSVVAVVLVVGFIITSLVNVGERNRKKGIEMHQTCVEAGFSGWNQRYGCIGGSGNGS